MYTQYHTYIYIHNDSKHSKGNNNSSSNDNNDKVIIITITYHIYIYIYHISCITYTVYIYIYMHIHTALPTFTPCVSSSITAPSGTRRLGSWRCFPRPPWWHPEASGRGTRPRWKTHGRYQWEQKEHILELWESPWKSTLNGVLMVKIKVNERFFP